MMCLTDGCRLFHVPVDVPDDVDQVVCGGGCGGVLKPIDLDNLVYLPEPSIDDLVQAEVARQLALLNPSS